MKSHLRVLAASAASLAISIGAATAADFDLRTDPIYAGTFTLGYQHTWTDYSRDYDCGFQCGKTESGEFGEWSTPFGEGAVLWRPADNVNLQADAAFHAHRFDFTGGKPSPNYELDQWHIGGVAFWRDPTMGLFGIDAAAGAVTGLGPSGELWRAGGRAEWFFDEMVTVGARGGYYALDWGLGKDVDGFYVNGFATLYATEALAVNAEFDYASLDFGYGKSLFPPSRDGHIWSAGGEVEYLLGDIWNGNTSVFLGGRYSETDVDFDDGKSTTTENSFENVMVFVGFRHYFNTSGSLSNQHRTNTLDNTNTVLERIPFEAIFN